MLQSEQMDPIADILERYPVILLDGALATELERRGCDLRDPLWSAKVLLEQPALIRQVHLDYFLAGADCATTASYQATVAGFARRGLDEGRARALIRRSVELAKEAREELRRRERGAASRPEPFIAASVGPFGAFLADGSEYRGAYGLDEEQLTAFHRPRLAALVEAGPDLIACETLPCFAEARALAGLLAEFPGMSAWFSFSARDGTHVSSGEPLAEVLAWLDPFPQVAAVGVNCTSPRFIPSLIREARSATGKPIIVYPNSGESYDSASGGWTGPRECAFGESTREWYALGARLIGGCCRTTPADIRVIAAWAREGSGSSR